MGRGGAETKARLAGSEAAKLEEARLSQASKTKSRDSWSSDMSVLGSDKGSLWVRISQATMLCIYH